MTQQIRAIFDGNVFRPQGPVKLAPNTRCVVTIQTPGEGATTDAWHLLDEMSGSIEAPADWSAEHDHYLYGTSRKKP